MLVSVRCPYCRTLYPPRQMHTCRPPSIQMRVKPIYDRNTGGDGIMAQAKADETVKPKTLSFGKGVMPDNPGPPVARQPKHKARPQEAGALVVGGVEIDEETVVTALKLLAKQQAHQRSYQKRKRAGK